MKYYNEDELKHFLKDGFRMYSDDEYYTKIASKGDEYRIGNTKAGFYTLTVPDKIDYKQAFELIGKTFYWTGIAKRELMETYQIIEASITEPTIVKTKG